MLNICGRKGEKKKGRRDNTHNTCCLTDDLEEYLVGHLDRGTKEILLIK